MNTGPLASLLLLIYLLALKSGPAFLRFFYEIQNIYKDDIDDIIGCTVKTVFSIFWESGV
jgi:hypothetical protein